MHCLLVLLAVLPMQVVGSEFTNWVAKFVPHIPMMDMEAITMQPWWLLLVAGCILPGFGEEIFFRGFLSRGLVGRHGVIGGTLIASLLFGLIHVDPVQASGAFLLGLGIQYVFLTTKSLAGPIVLHTLNNALAFTAMRAAGEFTIPGLTEAAEGQVFHTPLPLLAAAVATLCIVLTLFYQTRTRWVLPDGHEWSLGYVTAERPPAALGATARLGRPDLGLIFAALVAYALLLWAIFSAAIVLVP